MQLLQVMTFEPKTITCNNCTSAKGSLGGTRLYVDSVEKPGGKTYITGYSSILYIGIAMVFVFSPYIRKFTSCFQFQVNLRFYSTECVKSDLCTKYFTTFWPFYFCILSMVFFLLLNSITIVPLHTTLGICIGFSRS